MPGVCPAELQKRTRYVPTTSIQPEPSRTPTSHWGRKPPTSDAMSAATPTTDMKRTIVTAASAASAIARVATPP